MVPKYDSHFISSCTSLLVTTDTFSIKSPYNTEANALNGKDISPALLKIKCQSITDKTTD